MKKFFALLLTIFFLAAPVQAAQENVYVNDISAKDLNAAIENFYVALPKAKGDYKSSRRPILIEGAMNIETEILVRALKNPVAYRELNYLFVAGEYKNYPVVIVRTEQGVANAAAATALAIKKFNPVAVINQGTAGGHDPKLKIGDIVVGHKSFDYSACKIFYSAAGAGIDITKQELLGTYTYDETTKNFQPQKEYFADTELFNMAFKAANAHKNFNVVSGVIATGNTWIECVDYVNFLHKTYGSSCEEMETAPAASICQNAGVPFVGIRVLSDNVTNSREYNPNTAKTCQEFVLLVVENYVHDILRR